MRNTQNKKILRMVQMALLIALVVVLQILSALLPKIGGMISITLTLVPIVVGGILLGRRAGAVLGLAFGIIVMIMCIVALDPGGNMLWNVNPAFTTTICLVKGIAAGFVPAALYKTFAGKKETIGGTRKILATVFAAVSAPVVNTALFVAGMFIFFTDTLYAWAGGSNVVSYVILGLAGINFIVELSINIVLSPVVVRVVDVLEKKSIK